MMSLTENNFSQTKQPTIHLMCGFIGFGKTTIAKQLADKLSAVRFSHDDIMLERYGRQPDNFQEKYKSVDDFIKAEAAQCIQRGQDVIMDYGFWSHDKRALYYNWAKTLTDNVVFHVLYCDMDLAKKRTLQRSGTDAKALMIDENAFDALSSQFEPWSDKDQYPVVLYNTPVFQYIGKTVTVKMDRPLGSKHPKHGFTYPVNYGFIPYSLSGDGEELDAYVLGTNDPLQQFTGKCIAVIHRTNDDDDKLIVVPDGTDISDDDIEEQTAFQEKWFKHILVKHSEEHRTHSDLVFVEAPTQGPL